MPDKIQLFAIVLLPSWVQRFVGQAPADRLAQRATGPRTGIGARRGAHHGPGRPSHGASPDRAHRPSPHGTHRAPDRAGIGVHTTFVQKLSLTYYTHNCSSASW